MGPPTPGVDILPCGDGVDETGDCPVVPPHLLRFGYFSKSIEDPVTRLQSFIELDKYHRMKDVVEKCKNFQKFIRVLK